MPTIISKKKIKKEKKLHHLSWDILHQIFGEPKKENERYIWQREKLLITYCEDCKWVQFKKEQDPNGLRIVYFDADNFDSRFQELINWAIL